MRGGLSLFNPLFSFLQKSVENFKKHAIYNEDTISNILNVIINAIDTNKAN